MLSPAGHPFWRHVLQNAMKLQSSQDGPMSSFDGSLSRTLKLTGPWLLGNAIVSWPTAAANLQWFGPYSVEEDVHSLIEGHGYRHHSTSSWWLQESGAPDLHVAARNGDVAAVEQLIEQRADVRAAARDGREAIHWAAKHGHLALVKLLSRWGADSWVVAHSHGVAPIQAAVSRGHKSIVEYLAT